MNAPIANLLIAVIGSKWMTIGANVTFEVGGAINLMRHRLQMKWIHAFSIAAPMMNLATIWNGSDKSHVGKLVRHTADWRPKLAVPSSLCSSGPFPTKCFFVTFHLLRKPWKWIRWPSCLRVRIGSGCKQVVRTDAKDVLTLMHDKHSVWKRSFVDQPRNPMNEFGCPVKFDDLAVAENCFSSLPNPATIWLLRLFNLRPKAFKNGGRETLRNEEGERSVGLFGSLHILLLDRALSCYRSVRAFFFLRLPILTPIPVQLNP